MPAELDAFPQPSEAQAKLNEKAAALTQQEDLTPGQREGWRSSLQQEQEALDAKQQEEWKNKQTTDTPVVDKKPESVEGVSQEALDEVYRPTPKLVRMPDGTFETPENIAKAQDAGQEISGAYGTSGRRA